MKRNTRSAFAALGLFVSVLLIAACTNTVSYHGPLNAKGPSGRISIHLEADHEELDGASVTADAAGVKSGLNCTLVGTSELVYSNGFGTCQIHASSRDVWVYRGEFREFDVTIASPSPTPTPTPPTPAAAPSASPTPVVSASSTPPPSAQSSAETPAATTIAPAATRAPSASPTPRPTPSTSALASASASEVTPKTQTVTWTPSTNITSTTPSSDGGREFTPSTQASTNGDGDLTYSIGSPNTSACHLRLGRIVVVGHNGTCTVTATAAATTAYLGASVSVTFTIGNYTDPNPPTAPSPTPSPSPSIF